MQTSSGESVYANPDELESYIQSNPESFHLSTEPTEGDGPSEWREYLENLQVKARGRIDDHCNRDFEYHENDTLQVDGGSSVVFLPSPVHEIHEIRTGGSPVSEDKYEFKRSGALVADRSWPEGINALEVDLDHGYESPPPAIQEAEMKLVDHTVIGQIQKREGMTVQADSFEVKVNIPIAMNSEIREMLEPHQVRRLFN